MTRISWISGDTNFRNNQSHILLSANVFRVIKQIEKCLGEDEIRSLNLSFLWLTNNNHIYINYRTSASNDGYTAARILFPESFANVHSKCLRYDVKWNCNIWIFKYSWNYCDSFLLGIMFYYAYRLVPVSSFYNIETRFSLTPLFPTYSLYDQFARG